MLSSSEAFERRCLQTAVALAGCVPIFAGGYGMWKGTGFLDLGANVSADSHIRYLSGLLFGIGIAFWAAIPDIEKHAARFSLLTAIVFIGGLARLFSLLIDGTPDWGMRFGLLMELIVTPTIWAWQQRVARQCSTS